MRLGGNVFLHVLPVRPLQRRLDGDGCRVGLQGQKEEVGSRGLRLHHADQSSPFRLKYGFEARLSEFKSQLSHIQAVGVGRVAYLPEPQPLIFRVEMRAGSSWILSCAVNQGLTCSHSAYLAHELIFTTSVVKISG